MDPCHLIRYPWHFIMNPWHLIIDPWHLIMDPWLLFIDSCHLSSIVHVKLCILNCISIVFLQSSGYSAIQRRKMLVVSKTQHVESQREANMKDWLSDVNNFPSHNGVDDCPRRRFWSWNSQLSWLPNVERSKTSLSLFQNIHTTPLNSNESLKLKTPQPPPLWRIRSTRCSGVTLFQVVLYPVYETKNYKKIPKSFIFPNKLGFIHVIYMNQN